ncbi:MAG: aminotransferase class I/II-fold pyridoxal phosphate-dependent enzyme [Firmicutes bacterium]|nr:aminotransferase class I/II-fold pyridoxal phosphate-dependent enzyme [[Eubacterium] siraeum]MCM1488997.1 aminotransferase class I/II-fold pyridoxal phosphate-dependent enzyme [Bacillota bacterium]
MMYRDMNEEQLAAEKKAVKAKYEEYKALGLKLDMSRGKPAPSQLDLTDEMLLHCLDGAHISENGIDCRNYGVLDGIYEAKRLFMPMLGVGRYEIIIGGNSSLCMMYDNIARAMLLGVLGGKKPWSKYEHVKFLCPAPGYDRHFAICESMGIEMITVPYKADGPDMDMIEDLVSKDEEIKGIWCVPMYSNPTGITYSDEVVKRFANLSPKADDFRIFWDNAYCVHHLTDTPDTLLNILEECKKTGKENMVYIFTSTSKISFPGGGLAVMAASEENIKYVKRQMGYQTIGYDKLNQLRHARFFRDYEGVREHMKKHRAIIEPKFEVVLNTLEKEIAPLGIGSWHKPNGGYFVSFDGTDNTARITVALCKEAGVVLTDAGATFPYGKDPKDSNIRIAPTFPTVEELQKAMDIFCISARLACLSVMTD